jgi:transducin (beta)-like 1
MRFVYSFIYFTTFLVSSAAHTLSPHLLTLLAPTHSSQRGNPIPSPSDAIQFFGPETKPANVSTEFLDQHQRPRTRPVTPAQPAAQAPSPAPNFLNGRRPSDENSDRMLAYRPPSRPTSSRQTPTATAPAPTNGIENGDAMDIDADANGEPDDEIQAKIEEEPPTIAAPEAAAPVALAPQTNGHSSVAQVDYREPKVPDAVALSLGSPSRFLLSCAFSPTNPTLLAAAGTGTLARVWDVSSSAALTNGDGLAHAPVISTYDLDENLTNGAQEFVTAVAWRPSGDVVATARDTPSVGEITQHNHSSVGKVQLWSMTGPRRGKLELELDNPAHSIHILKWSPGGSRLLAISSPQESGAEVLVYNYSNPREVERYYSLSEGSNSMTDAGAQITDAAWIDESSFVICGDGVLRGYQIDKETESFRFLTEEDLNMVKWDPAGKRLATVDNHHVIKVITSYRAINRIK